MQVYKRVLVGIYLFFISQGGYSTLIRLKTLDDIIHPILHLLSGLTAFVILTRFETNFLTFSKLFAIFYFLLGVIGFIDLFNVPGIPLTMADHIFHFVISSAIFFASFKAENITQK
ncbi:MAG: hypothetical protein IH840_08450 [Candidatus Heimdallarchaeota archaeon]|nr:hypothetical protein [Candidatus Heimdallarchaeota archaeon]